MNEILEGGLKVKNFRILENYNKATKALNKVTDSICNLQREKDYRVTKIEKLYEAKISEQIVMQEQLGKIITLTKKIIGQK